METAEAAVEACPLREFRSRRAVALGVAVVEAAVTAAEAVILRVAAAAEAAEAGAAGTPAEVVAKAAAARGWEAGSSRSRRPVGRSPGRSSRTGASPRTQSCARSPRARRTGRCHSTSGGTWRWSPRRGWGRRTSARPMGRARQAGQAEAQAALAALVGPEALPQAEARAAPAEAACPPRSGSRTAAASAAGRRPVAAMVGPCIRTGSAATAGPSAPRAPRRPASWPSAAAAESVGPTTRPARPCPAVRRARPAACPASRALGSASRLVLGESRCVAAGEQRRSRNHLS